MLKINENNLRISPGLVKTPHKWKIYIEGNASMCDQNITWTSVDLHPH